MAACGPWCCSSCCSHGFSFAHEEEKWRKTAPALDEEQTLEIIKTLETSLQATCGKFSNAAEKIKMQMAQQGQQLDDSQIMQHFIYPHF